MSSHLLVSAQSEQHGMEHSALSQQIAEEANILMKNTNVSAHPTSSLRMEYVKPLVVLEVKYGMGLPVLVILGLTGMEQFVSFALMGRSGIQGHKPASVRMDTNGMGTSVKNSRLAQVEEFSTNNINNASVLKNITGMELNARKNLNVVVVKSGTKRLSSVIAQKISTGMEEVVCYVLLEKFGIL